MAVSVKNIYIKSGHAALILLRNSMYKTYLNLNSVWSHVKFFFVSSILCLRPTKATFLAEINILIK
jgi:hypothetical protein